MHPLHRLDISHMHPCPYFFAIGIAVSVGRCYSNVSDCCQLGDTVRRPDTPLLSDDTCPGLTIVFMYQIRWRANMEGPCPHDIRFML